MRFFERRIGEEHVAPDDLAGEDKVCFALYLFLQIAQDNAVFLFHRGGICIPIVGADLLIDVESAWYAGQCFAPPARVSVPMSFPHLAFA